MKKSCQHQTPSVKKLHARPRTVGRHHEKKGRQRKSALRACAQRIQGHETRQELQQLEQWIREQFRVAVEYVEARGILDASDTMQRSLAKAAQKYRPERGPLNPWIWRFIKLGVLDELRSMYRHPPAVPLEPEHLEALSVECEASASDRIACLSVIIDRLPPDLVEALLHCCHFEISQRDMTNILGLSLSALKMRLHRARRTLAAILRAAGCHSVEDVVNLGARVFRRPIVLTLPRHLRAQPRPSCQPHRPQQV